MNLFKAILNSIFKHYTTLITLTNIYLCSKEEMGAIYILIAISLLVALGFLVAFIWSVKSGQYDDDYSPAVRILFDDEVEKKD